MSEDLKVIFHIDNAEAQAAKMFRQINNQLNEDPTTKIKLVVSGLGLELLKKGWTTADKADYHKLLAEAKQRNVTIEACTYAMGVRGITEEDLYEDLIDEWIPSGSGRITKLQIQQGFAYFKP